MPEPTENRMTAAEYERRYGAAYRDRLAKWPWNKFGSAWAEQQAKPPVRKPPKV